MNIRGERVIIFGDSLSHPGPDTGPAIVDLAPTFFALQTSAPGEVLGRALLPHLLLDGAQAVRINAKVGRSARSFLFNEDSTSLLASDRVFRPTKVVIFLGTNDIDQGLDAASLARTRDAMTRIRDAYRAMGAEVFAIGPPMYQNARYNAGAPAMLDLMRGVFGADHTIDARPLTDPGLRARDGVHFTASSAAGTGSQLFKALLAVAAPAQPSTSVMSTGQKVAIGLAVAASFIGLSWLALRVAKRAAQQPGLSSNLGIVDDRLIERIAQALAHDVSTSEIHDQLIDEGYSEDDVYLAYKAAQMYLKHLDEPLPKWIKPDPSTSD